MPVSHRFKRANRLTAVPPPHDEYKIVDPHHVPDLRGELGATKVYRKGTEQFVRLHPRAARFLLDNGAIELAEPPPAPTDQ